jgi:hypothetical protein
MNRPEIIASAHERLSKLQVGQSATFDISKEQPVPTSGDLVAWILGLVGARWMRRKAV